MDHKESFHDRGYEGCSFSSTKFNEPRGEVNAIAGIEFEEGLLFRMV